MPKKSKGGSREDEARTTLSNAAALTRAEFTARAASVRAQQRPNKTHAGDLIREDRDR